MYVKHCKISRHKQLELIKYFVSGATAGTAAELAEFPRSCINGVVCGKVVKTTILVNG